MATGLYLKELLTVCSSATVLTAINAALTTQSMTNVTALVERPVVVTKPLKRPLIEVGLRPSRDRFSITADPTDGRIEEVLVDFVILVYEKEHEASAYEGIVLETVLGLKTTIAAGVTDAGLTRWEAIDGEAEADEGATNKDAWEVTVTFRAQIEVR